MVLYSEFTYGYQFSEETNGLEIRFLIPEILNKYKRSIFLRRPVAIEDMPGEDVLCAAGYVWRNCGRGRGNTQGSFREERSNAGGGEVDRLYKEHFFESLHQYLNKCPDRNEDRNKTKAMEFMEFTEKTTWSTEDTSKSISGFLGEAMSYGVLKLLDEKKMGEVRGPFPSNEGLEFGNRRRQLSKVTLAKMRDTRDGCGGVKNRLGWG